jgi:hypothetical protein
VVIKAVMHLNGKPVIFLGLRMENVTRMVTGEPVRVSLGEMIPALDGYDVIVAGPVDTEELVRRIREGSIEVGELHDETGELGGGPRG